MRDVRDFGVELVPGEGLTYHTRENLDTYFWYAWDTSHASDAKKPCFSYPWIDKHWYCSYVMDIDRITPMTYQSPAMVCIEHFNIHQIEPFVEMQICIL